MDSQSFLNAVGEGDIDTVRAAFRSDPSLSSTRTDSGATALQWAIYNRQAATADALLEEGYPLDFVSACTVGRLTTIPNGTDVNVLSADGFTPLALAVAFGHTDVAELLISHGADVNARSSALGGVAPIHAATFGRNISGIRMLLGNGADVNAPQEGGFTALHGAAQNNDLEAVELLLNHGADRELTTSEGKLPIDFAESPEVRAKLQKND